jgi:GntR family transcriptional regulator, N-acetylglucosamine utilization regulator
VFEIKRSAPVPIFQQIHDWMQEQIRSGEWPEHYKLDSETDLAAELAVNRGTVRKALAQLISEGALVTIHGRGTFVSYLKTLPPNERLVTFHEELLSKGTQFEMKVLGQVVQDASDLMGSVLSIKGSEQEFLLSRVLLVQGEPVGFLRNHVRYELCQGIEQIDFTTDRMFQILEGRFNLHLSWFQRSLEAKLADGEIAEALGIRVGDPLMYLEQVVYLKDDSPVECLQMWFRGDCFRLSALVRRTRGHWAPAGAREIVTMPEHRHGPGSTAGKPVA